MNRTNDKHAIYQEYLKKIDTSSCHFCKLPKEEIVRETNYFLIVLNIYGYQIWDSAKVTDHLLIIPKRHIGLKNEFSVEERTDFVDLLCEYEAQGYDIYSRNFGSTMKSVVHQHTHLIKVGKQKVKEFTFTSNPYHLSAEF